MAGVRLKVKDPKGLDVNAGAVVEDELVGGTVDEGVAWDRTLSDAYDDAENSGDAVDVLRDGGGEVEEDGVDETTGLVAGVVADSKFVIPKGGGRDVDDVP